MKILRKIICINLIFLLFIGTFDSFAEVSTLFPHGRGEFIKLGPGDAEIVVAGDSYSQHFLKDERNKGLRFIEFSREGTTVAENHNVLMEAFDALHKMVFFSISVNDHLRETHPAIFELNLREVMNKSVETEKIVFVHTYMHYPMSTYLVNKPFTTYEYDSIIRKLAAEYENVYYIDMSDCEGEEYATDDWLHYNKKFNDIMYDRLKETIDEIRNKV